MYCAAVAAAHVAGVVGHGLCSSLGLAITPGQDSSMGEVGGRAKGGGKEGKRAKVRWGLPFIWAVT